MDRREFVNSFMVDNIEQYVFNYFDQVMALYDLVGSCDVRNIVSRAHEDNSMRFSLLLSSHDSLIKLKSIVDNTQLCVYNRKYNMNANIFDTNTLLLDMKEITV